MNSEALDKEIRRVEIIKNYWSKRGYSNLRIRTETIEKFYGSMPLYVTRSNMINGMPPAKP